MKRKFLCVTLLFFFISIKTNACGPFRLEPLPYDSFSPILYQPYAQGELGVIGSNFNTRYLFIAYYQLINKPITSKTLELYQEFIKDNPQIQSCYATPTQYDNSEDQNANGYSLWVNLIKKYAEQRTKNPAERDAIMKKYLSVYSVNPSSLQFNADILKQKMETYGINSFQVKAWLERQIEVWNTDLTLKALNDNAVIVFSDPTAHYDWSYQHAAALFYRNKFEEAAQEFWNIFTDSKFQQSPYRDLSGYLYVRIFYDEAKYLSKDSAEAPDFAKVVLAIEKVIPIYKEEGRSSSYLSNVMQLSEAIQNRQNRHAALEKSSIKIATQDPSVSYQDWQDFSYLYQVIKQKKPIDNDLALWIFTLKRQETIVNPNEVAWQKWKESQKPHWLLAALVLASEKDPFVNDLIDAVDAVNHQYPGFETMLYHKIRLLGQQKQVEKQKAWQLIVENQNKHHTIIFKNYLGDLAFYNSPTIKQVEPFLSQQAIVQGSSEMLDPLHEKQCGPYLFGSEYQPINPLSILNATTTRTLQYLPPEFLYQNFNSTAIDNTIIAPIAVATFSRAVLLNHEGLIKNTAKWLGTVDERYQSGMGIILNSSTKDLSYNAILTLLRYPALTIAIEPIRRQNINIDVLDTQTGFNENWWTQYGINQDRLNQFLDSTVWLNNEEKQSAKITWKTLLNPSLATRICDIIFKHLETNPKDPTIPEAIHRMIQLTRRISDAPKESYELFLILHSKYKNTKWAKKTPHHYYEKPRSSS